MSSKGGIGMAAATFGVFRVTYSNGAKMYVNYNDSPTVMDGVSIPAMDYVVSAGK